MRYLVLAAALLLSACGGSGGGSNPPPPPPPPVDTTPPTLAAAANISPQQGATGVDYKTTVTVTASEALRSATVEVRCTEADTTETLVPGTTAVVGAVVTWTPSTSNVAAATCVARLTAFADNSGNAGTPTAISTFGIKPLDCAAPTNAGYTYTGGSTRAICRDIYVDSNAPRTSYVDTVIVKTRNVQRVLDFFGTLATDADFMYCGTPGCSTYFSTNGMATWRSPGFYIVLPDGSLGSQFARGMVVHMGIGGTTDSGVIAHELIHGELRARVSGGEVGGPRMPAWFDEGFATAVGSLNHLSTCTQFDGVPDLRSIVTNSDFNAANTAKPGVIYCQAAREVDAWLRSKGNAAAQRAAVLSLIDAVNAGTPFYTAYGALKF